MTGKRTGKKGILCLFLAVLMLTLSACAAEKGIASNDSMSNFAPSDTKGDYGYSADYDYAGGVMDDGMEAPMQPETSTDSSTDPTQGADSARKLIKNVSMELETLSYDEFIKELFNRIDAAGGYVQSSSENAGKYSSRYQYMRSAYITARIPADRLDFFCSGVEGACNVVSRREETSDVTLTYYDTESHMRALQSEYATLVAILEKCTKLDDVISVQRRITDVLYQIESYKTRLNNYDNLVAYSTVTMSVNEVKEETIVVEQTLGERISTGFKSTMTDLREGAEDFAVGFVANLPYILIWAVIIIGGVAIIRASVRRSQKKRLAKRNMKPQNDADDSEK